MYLWQVTLKSKTLGALTYNFGHSYVNTSATSRGCLLAKLELSFGLAVIWAAHIA